MLIHDEILKIAAAGVKLHHLADLLLKSHATHQVGHTLFYGKVTVGVVHDLFRTRPGDKP